MKLSMNPVAREMAPWRERPANTIHQSPNIVDELYAAHRDGMTNLTMGTPLLR